MLAPVLLLLAALVIHPVLEQGIDDDWSFTKSAQVLAATGHIVYNGGSSPILGWQLYLGALFIHLFGFSFTVVRLSTLPVALATAWLIYLSLVRCRVGARNASLATCLLSLSSVALPLTFTFMTDLSGLFAVVLCLYACLRARAAETSGRAIAWLALAILGNAVGGTARQIAWLGVLVMVPSLLWSMRRRRAVLLAGLALELCAGAFIGAVMHWFSRQPYTLPEPLLPAVVYDRQLIATLRLAAVQTIMELATWLLPVLIAFVPAVPWRRRGAQATMLTTLVCIVAASILVARKGKLDLIAQPTLGNIFTRYGVMSLHETVGNRAVLLPLWLGLGLTAISLLALAAACTVGWFGRDRAFLEPGRSDRGVAILLAPFGIAYSLMLMPRAAQISLFDRYILELVLIALPASLLLYQRRVAARLPALSVGLVALYGLLAVALTHDEFTLRRAQVAAVDEIRAAGIPARQISGGYEFDGWTEIESTGYVNDPRIPGHDYPLVPPAPGDTCAPLNVHLTPHLQRRFALAFAPNACMGFTTFSPVSYSTWLPLRRRTIYIVRDGAPHAGNDP